MKRIVFLNRFYAPDLSATSQILTDLARDLAARGVEVHAIASRGRHDGASARLPARETLDGVEVHRVAGAGFGGSRLAGRAAEYLAFYVAAWRALMTLAAPGDVLIAKTDPPLLSILAARAAARRGVVVVNWLKDLYPEVAIELGVPLVRGPIGRSLLRARDRSLAAARMNVAIGTAMAGRLKAHGVPETRLRIVPDWCDDTAIQPLSHAANPLRRDWGLEGRFAVGYSGTLGRAHEIETLMSAAERLRDDARIVFLCIGDGVGFRTLRARVEAGGLAQRFRFFPRQDRAALAQSLGAADAHWISLRPALEGLVLPSKLYGVAAAGRPILAVAARNGELARLVEAHACGIAIEPGDGAGFAAAIRHLASDPDAAASMGRRARVMLDAQFSRRAALERWQALLDEIG